MKITLLKDIFLERLNLASKFTSAKLSSATSLQGVYLKGEKNMIHLYSTNLNYFYHTSLKVENSSQFEIVIEPRKITEFLSLLNSGKIEIDIKEKEIIISQEKTRGDFPLFSKSDFPLPPKITSEKQKIKTSFLKESFPLVLFSTSSDETRPILTGINFVSQGEEMQLVATDGFRLSLLTVKKETSFPSSIIPGGFLAEILKMIKEEEEISFSYSNEEKLIVFYLADHEFYSRLIEGEYPPYEKVIPSEKKTTIVLDRSELLRKVKLTSIFAREFSNVIILKTEKDEIQLTPKTGEGKENVDYLEAEITGEPQKIAFNFKFLIDFLNNISSKKIIIELLRSDAPAVFRSENLKNFLHIIMPVRIQE